MKQRTGNVIIPRLRDGLIGIAIACLTVGLIWLAMIVGSRPDSQIMRFLESPGVVSDSLVESLRKTARQEDVPEAPLVKVARDFALYLNPPVKPDPALSSPKLEVAAMTTAVEVAPAVSSPKFELHGISYHSLRPEESMALVWLPDVGRKWVRQGTQLGHVIIEQITSSSILYRDGQASHEMALDLELASTRFARVGSGMPSAGLNSSSRITTSAASAPLKRPSLPPRIAVTDSSRFAGVPHGQTVTRPSRQKASPRDPKLRP
jgi:hypothetical protein